MTHPENESSRHLAYGEATGNVELSSTSALLVKGPHDAPVDSALTPKLDAFELRFLPPLIRAPHVQPVPQLRGYRRPSSWPDNITKKQHVSGKMTTVDVPVIIEKHNRLAYQLVGG